ncbi:unnamed protein product, partial [Urochloa humidicola]
MVPSLAKLAWRGASASNVGRTVKVATGSMLATTARSHFYIFFKGTGAARLVTVPRRKHF